MADLRESCLLFSLKHLEQQRAQEEELGSWRRAEAQMAARIQAEHRARIEQEALMRAEEARLHAEAAARREEAARHQAVRFAALEKARILAEQAAKIELLTQQQEHERKLVALERDQERRALRRSLSGGAAMTTAILGTLAFVHFAHIRPEAERVHRREAEVAAAREVYVTQLRAEVARANQRAETARRALEQLQAAAAARADEPPSGETAKPEPRALR